MINVHLFTGHLILLKESLRWFFWSLEDVSIFLAKVMTWCKAYVDSKWFGDLEEIVTSIVFRICKSFTTYIYMYKCMCEWMHIKLI